MNPPNPLPQGKDFLAAELEDPDRPFKTPDKRLNAPTGKPGRTGKTGKLRKTGKLDKPAAVAVATAGPAHGNGHGGDMTTRILSWEGSLALHLAVLLVWLGAQRTMPAPDKPAEKVVELIPIEVNFQPETVVPAPKAAPQAPVRPKDPEPAPRAPDVPDRPVARQQAAAPKSLPPKQAVRQAAPAPKPAQKAYERPKAPDLQAALNARLNQGKSQEEQRLSQLRDRARSGSDDAPNTPAAGVPAGNPQTSTSGLSGSVASRGILNRVSPVYPVAAQRSLAEGTVVLRLYVNAAGMVARTEVVRSSGHLMLDRAAASAARQWVFSPSEGSGLEWGDVPFNFTI